MQNRLFSKMLINLLLLIIIIINIVFFYFYFTSLLKDNIIKTQIFVMSHYMNFDDISNYEDDNYKVVLLPSYSHDNIKVISYILKDEDYESTAVIKQINEECIISNFRSLFHLKSNPFTFDNITNRDLDLLKAEEETNRFKLRTSIITYFIFLIIIFCFRNLDENDNLSDSLPDCSTNDQDELSRLKRELRETKDSLEVLKKTFIILKK